MHFSPSPSPLSDNVYASSSTVASLGEADLLTVDPAPTLASVAAPAPVVAPAPVAARAPSPAPELPADALSMADLSVDHVAAEARADVDELLKIRYAPPYNEIHATLADVEAQLTAKILETKKLSDAVAAARNAADAPLASAADRAAVAAAAAQLGIPGAASASPGSLKTELHALSRELKTQLVTFVSKLNAEKRSVDADRSVLDAEIAALEKAHVAHSATLASTSDSVAQLKAHYDARLAALADNNVDAQLVQRVHDLRAQLSAWRSKAAALETHIAQRDAVEAKAAIPLSLAPTARQERRLKRTFKRVELYIERFNTLVSAQSSLRSLMTRTYDDM